MIKFIKNNRFGENWFNRFWNSRRERFYKKNHWHLILDFSLAIIIILLVATNITLYFYHPNINKIVNQPLPEKLELDLNNPPLIFDFSVASSSFSLAEGAELKINLLNGSNLDVKDIKISLLPVGSNFSINKIEIIDTGSANAEIQINNKQIIINSLNSNQAEELKVKIYFKNKTTAERTIEWRTQIEYSIKGQVIKESVNLPDLYLAAELSAQAVIYYNSPQGDELGSGPLPPLIGLPTNYWVFFEVYSAGDFKNMVFSAKLPKGVELTDRRSLLAGEFKYNSSSRQVIWTVPELKNQSDSYRVGFEIQFIPEENQFDQTALLLSNLKCYAYDKLIDQEQYVGLKDLDTNLNFDRLNKGEGKIGRP